MKKKQYTAPAFTVTVIRVCHSLLQASATGLEGFDGNGGESTGGMEADARNGFWDDDEDGF